MPLIRYATLFVLILVVWTLLYALFPEDAKPPNGPLFSLVLLCVAGYASGQILKLIFLPPLLGMMLCGMVLANAGMFEMTGIYAQIIVKIR